MSLIEPHLKYKHFDVLIQAVVHAQRWNMSEKAEIQQHALPIAMGSGFAVSIVEYEDAEDKTIVGYLGDPRFPC